MGEAILSIEAVCKYFGGLKAVEMVSFEVKKGEIFAIIGPNGAGKTTLFNCITCYSPATHGSIVYKGNPVGKKTPHEITELGITRTWQNVRVFPNFSVAENIYCGRICRTHAGIAKSIIRTGLAKREEKESWEKTASIVEFMGLDEVKGKMAKSLSYGYQKKLEIGRALATEPDILLLDEPAAGLNSSETLELMDTIRKIRESGVTILLIEHDMKMVMGISDRIVVLDHGEKLAEGNPDEIWNNEKVVVSYLGEVESEDDDA